MRNNGKRSSSYLRLSDGTRFEGISFGYPWSVSGEVVFTTGMVGYPESLTDPSYHGQVLVCTYPLLGNYGVPVREGHRTLRAECFESDRIHIAGLVVQDYSRNFSHWASTRSLASWLKKWRIPAITGVDTRALTMRLREKGVMLGTLVAGGSGFMRKGQGTRDDPNARNLIAEVSCGTLMLYTAPQRQKRARRILLYDCGVKLSILRSLLARNCDVIRVPWNYDLERSRMRFDGIVISNGPGDPKMCVETIASIQYAISKDIPLFGICLGSQLLARAAGANTYKLTYGHRSQNQPCLLVGSDRCFITTQNHGYAIRHGTLPRGWKVWFANANDGTIEGIRHARKPFMAVQFHPESHPGPQDTEWIFDMFLKTV